MCNFVFLKFDEVKKEIMTSYLVLFPDVFKLHCRIIKIFTVARAGQSSVNERRFSKIKESVR